MLERELSEWFEERTGQYNFVTPSPSTYEVCKLSTEADSLVFDLATLGTKHMEWNRLELLRCPWLIFLG